MTAGGLLKKHDRLLHRVDEWFQRLDYYEIQAIEQEVTEDLSQRMLATLRDEATIFIPSIIVNANALKHKRSGDS